MLRVVFALVRADGQALPDMLVYYSVEECFVHALVIHAARLNAGNRPPVANAEAFNCVGDNMAEGWL